VLDQLQQEVPLGRVLRTRPQVDASKARVTCDIGFPRPGPDAAIVGDDDEAEFGDDRDPVRVVGRKDRVGGWPAAEDDVSAEADQGEAETAEVLVDEEPHSAQRQAIRTHAMRRCPRE
jgi:hypothetical protein